MVVPHEDDEAPSVWSVDDVIDGRYKVAGVLGRGSMGVVYRVRHLVWGTDLAVKSPRPALVRNPAARDLFVAEAETWVSLGLHPNVCGCHYVRTLGGIPRVFAEYVPGGTLREWIEDRRLYRGDRQEALARILDVAVQMAWGLEHAHSRELVHQDVKPANVLLDSAGTAKITDFGLALVRDAASTLDPDAPPGASTLIPGGGGMTPEYASPEQVENRRLGRRTDVYSFAVSVLEMFTGAITWGSGPDAGAALADCRTGGAAGLPAMPSAMADLLARCLHEDPVWRPGSMAKVVTSLVGIYQDAVGLPYPRSAPVAADLLADEFNNRALSLLDLGRRDQAAGELRKALEADPQNVAARYNTGLARWRAGTLTDAEFVAEMEALRSDAGDPWEARYLLAQVHMERGDLASATSLLEDVAEEQPNEPDVTAALAVVRSDEIIDARCVAEWEIAWPPYTGRESINRGEPFSWEGARKGVLNMGWRATFHDDAALALTPDGQLALTGTWDGKVRWWDVRSGRCLRTLDGHRKSVQTISLSPDGYYALSADEDGGICVWDLADEFSPRKHMVAFQDRAGVQLARVSLSEDGLAAYWASALGIVIMDTGSGEQWRSWLGHDGGARAVQASPERRWLLSSGREDAVVGNWQESVRVWDLETGRCRHVLAGHKSWVTAMCFSADERFAATGSHDRTIRIWDVAAGTCVRILRGHTADTLSLSADVKFLLSGDVFDGAVRFWETDSGRCRRTFPGHGKGVGVVVLEPNGRFGLSFGQDRKVRRWRLPGGYEARPSLSRPRTHTELSQLGNEVNALVAEAEQAMTDGRFPKAFALLTQARDTAGHEREPSVLSAWWKLSHHAVRTGLRAAWSPRVLAGHADSVQAVDMAGDGRVAVSGSSDGTVRAWALDSGTCIRVLEGHERTVESVSLSSDGRSVLSGAGTAQRACGASKRASVK
ncbi:protein kinase domain-containing protein [Streptomyces sp. CA-100214]